MISNKKVAIVMGSQSDYVVMKKCEEILKILRIKYETKIVSAHRTPDRMFEFSKTAAKNNFSVIVAGAFESSLKIIVLILSFLAATANMPPN